MPLTAHIATALRQSQQRIVVTGASGWLGRATLDLLHDALGEAFANRVVCFGSGRGEVRLSATRVIEQRPLSELGTLPRQPTLLLHFAFLGKERAEAMPEPEYRAANRAIRQTVLDSLDRIGVEAAFVASSGAARHADDASASHAMQLYGTLKREDEDAFAAWADANAARTVIGRIFNISGPHINKVDSYALSSFLLDALAGGPVVVRARHDVRRGYVAIRELLSLVFALLLEQQNGVVRFDSGGEDTELGALAAMIASSMNCAVERPALRTGTADSYLGDDHSYRRLLAHHRIISVPLTQQIAETATFLKTGSARSELQDAYA
ncbi:NAD(P)-dependent oxidoreductase [Novosphingobium sp.]|uniref:NAD-dependent epimerase/dehydratase family protein n=1 Tax=Novosphingobium sp. TaxID=1874826 RepID=UPI0025F5BC95|nr:NAD-dependent epimerase/dehydratase family protein [Novosphingobium sp.]